MMMSGRRAPALSRDVDFRVEIGNNVLAGRDCLLDGRYLHQLFGRDRAIASLQLDHQIAPLLFKLNERQPVIGKVSHHDLFQPFGLDDMTYGTRLLKSACRYPANFNDIAVPAALSRMFAMNGKVVVVTGASGALGKVVADMALARGACLARIDHAPSQIADKPDSIELGGVDLSDAAQARKAIEAAVAHFGKLDALINIAGGFAFETVLEGDAKTWQHMYALNMLTTLNASRAAMEHLAKSNAGRIVNVGAQAALQAGAGMGAYAASKAGVHRLTEALAAEWRGKITVNAVLPSIIDTPANRASMPNADFGKWVRPEELAKVILFLASEAASAVTGALLPVSGRV